MAGGAARLRAGSAGPVAAQPGPTRGHGTRWRTTPRAASRSGYPVPSGKAAVAERGAVSRSGYPVTSGKAQRPVLQADPTPLHDLLEVCGSSLHSARGVRCSTPAAAVPSRGVPRGPQRSNSFRASPPVDPPGMASAPAAEPVRPVPAMEVEAEMAAEPEQTENEDPWAQRLARLERIRLGLASVSTERPWAMPRPATAAPSREVRSTPSTAGQRQYGRDSGSRGREAVLENTEAEAAAVLAAAMSDAELQAVAHARASASSAPGAEELYKPQQPSVLAEPSEPLAQPMNCWQSPSAAADSHMDHARHQYAGESPQRPPQVHGLCTPISRGNDLLNAEVLYDSMVESSCSSMNWPSASSRAGSKGVGEACVDSQSERLPEPSWSIESTVAATPDLMYRSRDSVGTHSVEAVLSVASSPTAFADISSGHSAAAFHSGDSCRCSPLQSQHCNDVASMCLYGKAYGPSTPSIVGPDNTAPSLDDAAKPEMLPLKEQAELDGNLCCQGQAIVIDAWQPRACWQSEQAQKREDLSQLEQPSFSLSSGVPLLVRGHSVGDPGQGLQAGCERAIACQVSSESCTPAQSIETSRTTGQGFHRFLDELRDLRSQALNGPQDSVASFEECSALRGPVEDMVVATSSEAVAQQFEYEHFSSDLPASTTSYTSAMDRDESDFLQSEAEPAALPITDGNSLLELQQFLRRAGVEDLMPVVCAHAADSLEALLALPAPVIRRLPAHRARLQRLIQALTTERGRRLCSWTAERHDVLRSQDVLRRASSVQRGTSGRRCSNRSQNTSSLSRFQPGPRTRKACASQPRSGEPPARNNMCPRPRKVEKNDGVKEQVRLAKPIASVPLADGCDDAGFFITCLDGAEAHPDVEKSTHTGSAQAHSELLGPPTHSSSSTAPSSAPASSSASMPSAWMPCHQKDDTMSAPGLEQCLQLATAVQAEQFPVATPEPLQPPPEPRRLPLRASSGLAEQVLQASLPSARCSGPPACSSSRPQTRPQTRQARIRQLLHNLIEVPPCPIEAARVDSRQQQAYERHMRLRSRSPGGRRGNDGQGEASPSSVFRRSRSLMDLVSDGPTLLELSMADPPGWRPRRGPACPDPVPGELLESLLERLPTVVAAPGLTEPCTICLDVPEPGEMVTTLTCCHWYHRECIREWLSHSRLCPLCKASAMPEEGG